MHLLHSKTTYSVRPPARDDFGLGESSLFSSAFPRYQMSSSPGDYSLAIRGVAMEDDAKFQCQVACPEDPCKPSDSISVIPGRSRRGGSSHPVKGGQYCCAGIVITGLVVFHLPARCARRPQ